MDPQSSILLLKALLDALPLVLANVQIARERGEYTDEEWNLVKAKAAAFNTHPAMQIEPDPDQTGSK